ncbi:MAG: hypothetical protein AB7F98_01940 [Novosphingobium sp.]
MSTLAVVTAIPAAMMQPDPAMAQPVQVQVWASETQNHVELVKSAPDARPVASAVQQTAPGQPQYVRIWARGTQDHVELVKAVTDETPALPAASPDLADAGPAIVRQSGALASAAEGAPLPPGADPLINDIVWTNGVTAYHRGEVARDGWRKIVPFEVAWQLLNVLDIVQTISCSKRPSCEEGNPLFGDRPSVGTVLAVKGGMAIAHYLLMRSAARRNWKTARTAEIGTILVQGVIDGLNFRYAF